MNVAGEVAKRPLFEEIVSRCGDSQHRKTILMGHVVMDIVEQRTLMHRSDEEKSKLKNRLRRVAGQVDAVQRMIDDDEYCVDILMQISAATGALNKVGEVILEEHLKSCVRDAIENGNEKDRDQKLEELIAIFRKYKK